MQAPSSGSSESSAQASAAAPATAASPAGALPAVDRGRVLAVCAQVSVLVAALGVGLRQLAPAISPAIKDGYGDAELKNNLSGANRKSLRHGIDSAFISDAAIVGLLIKKGVITNDEHLEALAEAADAEAERYRAEVARAYGTTADKIEASKQATARLVRRR